MTEIKDFKIVNKHENCDGGLIPASNIKNCCVCLKCKCIIKSKEIK